LKVRFKRSQKFKEMMIEIENDGKNIEFPISEMDHFIENREVNQVIFEQEMTKEEKVNLKLMLEKLIKQVTL
jgi:expansin (peptidoglycan-binding protein)